MAARVRQHASGASRSTRPPPATRCRGRRRAARLQRVAVPAAARGRRGDHRGAARRSTATRTRRTRRCAARCATATACPAERIAIGNGSCDVLLALGEALLEPGAELVYAWPSFSRLPAPGGGVGRHARSRVPLNDARRARPRGDARPRSPRHAPGDRLQPEQPDERPRCRSTAIADFVARVPRHVCVLVDEAYCEFNTLDDPDTTLDAARTPPEPRPAAHVRKVYGLAGLRVGFALCGSAELRRRRSTRCASRSSATPPRRPRRSRRCATRTTSPSASSAPCSPRVEIADGLERARASSRRRVAGQLLLVRPAGETARTPAASSAASSAACASAACSCAPAPRSAARAPARHLRDAGRERALPRGARRADAAPLAV